MTNARRMREALLSGTVALAACMIAKLVASPFAGIEHAEALAIEHRAVVAGSASSLSTIVGNAAAAFSDVADVARSEIIKSAFARQVSANAEIARQEVARPEIADPEIADPEITNPEITKQEIAEPQVLAPAVATPVPPEKTVVVATLTDPAELLPPEADAREAKSEPNGERKIAVTSIEILDECFVVDVCVDRFLWALYQRAPKEDTIKVPELTQVTVKRKGKMVTVTRTVTKLVDEDFGWKDPKAAARANMAMQDYVIGGMDRRFKLKLFYALNAAEQAGLSPGITSAFRDDYRQSIASGLKAASNRSFHGGSLRGGYGHGLAADVVSVTGGTRDERWASSEKLWKWLDARGKEFGVGRPYLNRDPPHLAPTDGGEYVSRRGGGTRQAKADVKKGHRPAISANRSVAKPPKTATASKGRAT